MRVKERDVSINLMAKSKIITIFSWYHIVLVNRLCSPVTAARCFVISACGVVIALSRRHNGVVFVCGIAFTFDGIILSLSQNTGALLFHLFIHLIRAVDKFGACKK